MSESAPKLNAGMFSSATDDWATPQKFFDRLNREFGFELDVCASAKNAKCERFFDREADGLAQDWTGVCWLNPPYGRTIGKWVEKAALAAANGATVVALLPARTDTRWFHRYCARHEVRLIPGRLHFNECPTAAPFPSMVVVFRAKRERGAPKRYAAAQLALATARTHKVWDT